MEYDPTKIKLNEVSREDILRIREWLDDDVISDSWFGRYAYGDPAHLGYNPKTVLFSDGSTWDAIFSNNEHKIFSIYTSDDQHIGEVHLSIELSLGDAHYSVLIGRQDMWHKGYGTLATLKTLDMAFNELNLYRVWVDIPTFNTGAINLFDHLGFTHEGTLRKSRPLAGSRFNSVIMGMLSNEYHSQLQKSSPTFNI